MMMANGQHEDLIKFVSEAWTRIVENSRGDGPIFYKCNVPEHRNSYSNSQAATANHGATTSSSSSSSSPVANQAPSGNYNKANVPFRQ